MDKPMGLTRPLPVSGAKAADSGLRGLADYQTDINSESQADQKEDIVHLLPIHKLINYKYNPRCVYEEDKIKMMSDSIRAHGLINPIHVVPDDKKSGFYQVIAGRTRLKAITKYLKDIPSLQAIPAIIHKSKDVKEIAVLAFMENEKRNDHYDVDTGLYWGKLINDGVFQSQSDLAGAMGTTDSMVSRMLCYTKLSKEILEIVLQNPERFTYNFAELIFKIQERHGADVGLKLAEKVSSKSVTIKQLQEVLARGPAEKDINGRKTKRVNIVESKNIRASAVFDGYGRVEFLLSAYTDKDNEGKILDSLREAAIRLLKDFSADEKDAGHDKEVSEET